MEMARHGPMRHFVASVKASDFVLSLAIIVIGRGIISRTHVKFSL
jgi:hypothetical protein